MCVILSRVKDWEAGVEFLFVSENVNLKNFSL
jgi:hypothetical protein